MAKPRVLILRAPGTNCDEETSYAFSLVGAEPQSIHINRLIESPEVGADFQILCLPGGFSYGDDIAAGRILAQRLSIHLADLVARFRDEDRLVLGICNGFQVMMRLGIFFPPDRYPAALDQPPATLAFNLQQRFEDRWVHLKVDNSNCIFLRDIDQMFLPIAHAEGRFVIRDPKTAAGLTEGQQLGLRYCTEDGNTDESIGYPFNPNGADHNVAGISDPSGRIFGLMPHPERFVDKVQHPYWTRLNQAPDHGDGLKVFENAVAYFS